LGLAMTSVGAATGAGTTTLGLELGAVEGVTLGVALGAVVGAALGDGVGAALGVALGAVVGAALGLKLGDGVGAALGLALGAVVGATLGDGVGAALGLELGDDEGAALGLEVGLGVGGYDTVKDALDASIAEETAKSTMFALYSPTLSGQIFPLIDSSGLPAPNVSVPLGFIAISDETVFVPLCANNTKMNCDKGIGEAAEGRDSVMTSVKSIGVVFP
jgi:hypothetical protein